MRFDIHIYFQLIRKSIDQCAQIIIYLTDNYYCSIIFSNQCRIGSCCLKEVILKRICTGVRRAVEVSFSQGKVVRLALWTSNLDCDYVCTAANNQFWFLAILQGIAIMIVNIWNTEFGKGSILRGS